MKKLIALFAIASVATAFAAEDEDKDNVFGCLRVDSLDAETIVSIPWVGAGVGDSAITVADIVKTTNLTEGDELWWYDPKTDGGKYYTWKLNKDGVWEGVEIVANNGKPDAAVGSNQALARGNAILLIRQYPSVPFYLYGQVKSGAVGEQELPSGAQSLIAPPYVGNTDLNDKTKVVWSGVGTKDNLYVPNPNRASAQPFLILDYHDNEWGYTGSKGRVTDAAVVPAGQGVWFKSVNGTNTKVEWK